MHRNCKKRSFAPRNSGFSCKMRTKTPRGIQPVNSNERCACNSMYEQPGLYTCRSRIQQSIRIKKTALSITSWAVRLGGAPDSLVHGLCTRNAVCSVVKVPEKGKVVPLINTDKKSKKRALQMKLYQKYFANRFSPRRMLSRTRLGSAPSAPAIAFTVIPR